jgi:hypothetical protein
MKIKYNYTLTKEELVNMLVDGNNGSDLWTFLPDNMKEKLSSKMDEHILTKRAELIKKSRPNLIKIARKTLNLNLKILNKDRLISYTLNNYML